MYNLLVFKLCWIYILLIVPTSPYNNFPDIRRSSCGMTGGDTEKQTGKHTQTQPIKNVSQIHFLIFSNVTIANQQEL